MISANRPDRAHCTPALLETAKLRTQHMQQNVNVAQQSLNALQQALTPVPEILLFNLLLLKTIVC